MVLRIKQKKSPPSVPQPVCSNVLKAFDWQIYGMYFKKEFQRFPKTQIRLESPILSAGKQSEWIGCDMDFFWKFVWISGSEQDKPYSPFLLLLF